MVREPSDLAESFNPGFSLNLNLQVLRLTLPNLRIHTTIPSHDRVAKRKPNAPTILNEVSNIHTLAKKEQYKKLQINDNNEVTLQRHRWERGQDPFLGGALGSWQKAY